ncbi:ABC transporter substrate-binding protein [Occultella aeris]|uniref:ABC transporter substrate-binding protein YesO n=1 Tax=Occultella aeris TaxID=2761496 RepID=A0A7M4DPK6_9MICO|nr:ABC transporter substrate-binding protein [Occultella aeris]VZO39400.1 Putative ABC transporter substrate-binding protein YesO [Occultella aeris]
MNRRNFLSLGAITVGGAAAGTLAACGTGAGGSTADGGELRVAQYGSAHRMELFEQLFTAYSQKNPDWSLALDAASNDAYLDKLATQVSGGNAPAVMGLFHNAVAQFARQNALVELDPYLGDALDTSTFTDGIVELGRIDGQVRGLSYGDNAHGVMYDVDRLESLGLTLPEPGYTWEDFLTFSADITRAVDEDFYGTEDRSSQLDQVFKVWLLQRGKYAYTESGELGFNQTDLTDWLELWQMLRDEGAAPPADITAEAGGTFDSSALIRGYAANHLTYANALASMQALTPATLRLTTNPIDPGGQGSGHFIRGSNWVGVYSRTEHADAAVDFLDFVLNDPDGVAILGAELGAPPNRELRAELEYSEPEQDFIDYIDLVTDEIGESAIPLAQEFPPSWSDVNTAFTAAVEDHRFGRSTVEESVDRFFATAESAIQASA